MFWPTLGVGLLTALVTCRSACCGVSVALALLLPVLGSNWSAALTRAVLVRAVVLSTNARSCSVALLPLASVPTLQRPVVALYVPWLGVLVRSVSPAGRRSVNCT